MFKTISLIGYLFFLNEAQSQYVPLKSDKAKQSKYIQDSEDQLEADKANIKGTFKKEISKTYSLRTNRNISLAKEGYYILDAESQAYFDKIIDQIADANPKFDFSKIKPVLSRSSVPNAYSTGEGTIVFNMGLFPKIKTEGQLGFIICHEIAHFFLNHSNNNIYSQFNKQKSNEWQARLKEIEESEYYQTTKLKILIKEYTYKLRDFSRKNEYEADSLGFELFSNTKFPIADAFSTMDVLESLNHDEKESTVNIKSIFNISPVFMEKNPILGEAGPLIGDLNDDSMQTHPDCADRKQVLQELSKKSSTSNPHYFYQEDLEIIQQKMTYELCESYLQNNQYDLSLLYALRKLEKDSENVYFKSAAAKSVFNLFLLRKQHHLHLFIPSPEETTDSSQKELSTILFESRFSNFTKAAYAYCKSQINQNPDEYELYMLVLLSHTGADKTVHDKYKNQYLEDYPRGKYIKQIPIK